MKLFTMIAILASCIVAQAQIKPYTGGAAKADNPEYKSFYQSEGKTLDAGGALMSLVAGKEVYHCVVQEATASKNGKSIAMKNVKAKR